MKTGSSTASINIPVSDFIEEQYRKYNNEGFITDDPVSVPHQFNSDQDIEISGLLTALISWGRRPQILLHANDMMDRLENSPHHFIVTANDSELSEVSKGFVHRTFNENDFYHTLRALKAVYANYDSMDNLFSGFAKKNQDMGMIISSFSAYMCSFESPSRLRKHYADPLAGSAAKRICMFLRWMVRKDGSGVDFGIWHSLKPSQLMCPLDVHSGRVARSLGLLKRKQNDWKAVVELTENLRLFDPEDPVKYDFALFGSGMYEDHWT